MYDWLGKYWARWGDAVSEAGLAPNPWTAAYDEQFLIENYVSLARQLGKLPTKDEIRMECRKNAEFPSTGPFRRLGSKVDLIARIVNFCESRDGYEDILQMCKSFVPRSPLSRGSAAAMSEFGFVYLIRSGHFYKIGKTNSCGRREYELAIQLPEKAKTVHVIRTDDPTGIETYWHKRFELKRKNGEWFDLSQQDVAAFKRRRFM